MSVQQIDHDLVRATLASLADAEREGYCRAIADVLEVLRSEPEDATALDALEAVRAFAEGSGVR